MKRYKITYERAGISCCKSEANTYEEAKKIANEKALVSDHPVIIYDNKKQLVTDTIY